jgi:hypothetical protein
MESRLRAYVERLGWLTVIIAVVAIIYLNR